ncbi:BatA domain-containing protein [Flagellimonas meishanensis]|uniref:BatA domain-containing protein n=1 Tax=Flagellimonas meishanensis TaxID=2873264 RepID=UPI00223BFAF4|nr:BatA domain-containing protein [[Muricauda] meishanensis]
MQFKHPEILWALFLLLIPIVIHLFQLRRFQKTPFTNVAMLQKVVSESRKSQSLKKWLLLVTRISLLASLVLAFAQPFVANEAALKEKETVIYLDNSFSMQAKKNGLPLLQKAIQDLIKNVGDEHTLSLFTNENTFRDVNIKNIQNNLLSLPYTHRQLSLDEIQIKAKTLFSNSSASIKDLIIISDFQQRMRGSTIDSILNTYLVQIQPNSGYNVAVDSVSLHEAVSEQRKITVFISGGQPEEDLPISLYNSDTLIAKSSATFNDRGRASIDFSLLSGVVINGRLQIADNSLGYDNRFFFNIDQKPKINVLAISNSDSDYLERLYTEDEFNFTRNELDQLNYSVLDKQAVVILDNLESIPQSLQKVLHAFRADGGTLIIVPSVNADLANYNQFLSGLGAIRLLEKLQADRRITSISFDHPLYANVFEKNVTNFQYPSVSQYFSIQTKLPNVLGMEGNIPFLFGDDGLYLFSASLELSNTNFKNSPLIVPTFYNMGVSGLKTPKIYHTLGRPEVVDVAVQPTGDNILKVSNDSYEFIPQQQRFSNRTRLTFDENPTIDGTYTIHENDAPLRNISFNFPRNESMLNYMDLEKSLAANIHDSVEELFQQLKAESSISAYWKWFVILALLLALLEVIIQKFVA